MEADIKAGPSIRPEAAATGKRRSVLPPRPAVDLSRELDTLRERLGAVQTLELEEGSAVQDSDEWSRRLERLKLADRTSSDRPSAADAATGESDRGDTGDRYPISDLDKRLARLEAALGSDEMTVSSSSHRLAMGADHQDIFAALTSAQRPPSLAFHSAPTPRRHISACQTPPRRPRPRSDGISSESPCYSQPRLISREASFRHLTLSSRVRTVTAAFRRLTTTRPASTHRRPPIDKIEESTTSSRRG